MKVVINKCFGGFSLSPLAVKRLAELNGKECYFFKSNGFGDNSEYIPITLEEAKKGFMCFAFSVNNPNDYLRANKKSWHDMTPEEKETDNKKYDDIFLSERDVERNDKNLLRVVKELGKEANGMCAELKVVTIPDGTNYEISEYDGLEHIAEVHKTWG
jgi:hypothetical protein